MFPRRHNSRASSEPDRAAARERILVLSEVFPPRNGGSGRWLWEHYRRLVGADVWVLAGEADGAEEFDRRAPLPIDRLRLRFADWGITRPSVACHYARAAKRVLATTRRRRPDVIDCGKSLPEGLIVWPVSRLTGIPFRCYVHGEELTLARTSAELKYLTHRVLHAAANLIANSQHSKHLLVRDWNVPEEKITVQHPGVDTTRFRPAPRDPVIRQRLGWDDRPVVLTVGTLQKRKGQDMMIRALPAIRRQCPAVLYVMVGDGWDREYLERLVREMNVTDAVQFRRAPSDIDLIECYQQCDLFALPNRQIGWDFEGFGIVLLEAQACGKPVVAGLSGGTPETLDLSATGELVACDEPGGLAHVVMNLLADSDRRSSMGHLARDWAVTHFDWDVLYSHRELRSAASFG